LSLNHPNGVDHSLCRVCPAHEAAATDAVARNFRGFSLLQSGLGVVDRIITDLAAMDVTPQGLKVLDIA